MKKEFEKITIRKARETDCVEEISKGIFLTDPYIYPAICFSPSDEQWLEYIALSFKQKNHLFSSQNLYVADLDKKIVGICCCIKGGKTYTAICPDASLCKTDRFQKVNDGYFGPLLKENTTLTGHNIINLCVLPDYRRKHVGLLLLNEIVQSYGDEDLILDVLANNEAAISLYTLCGFTPVSYYTGFSESGGVDCLHMIRKGSRL